MPNKEKHVLIVGAGIAGLTTAYYLNQKGFEVTVFERFNGDDNSSYGNAGLVAPRHIIPLSSPGVINKGLRWMFKKESPFYIKPRFNKDLASWLWKFKKSATQKHVDEAGPVLRDMLFRNQDLLIELEKNEGLDFDFHKNGHLTLCETERTLNKEIVNAKKANELKVPTQILSAEEVFEKEPDVPKNIKGAVFYPKDAHLHPGKLMNGLKKLLKASGVHFKVNTKVIDLCQKSPDHVEIKTSHHKIVKGTDVVLCSGTWTPNLLKKLHINLPVQAGKGYSITLKNPATLPTANFLIADKKVAVTPMGNSIRFAGTMEIVDEKDKSITKSKVRALKKAIIQFYPQYTMNNLDGKEVWAGLRPCSPDGLPYVGKLDSFDNIFVSTGYSMVGMSLSLAGAEMITQLIEDGKAKLAHPLNDPNRYNKHNKIKKHAAKQNLV